MTAPEAAPRYARLERERRWLLAGVPDLSGAVPRRIDDRYVDGTRLRLRTVTAADGEVIRKVGHKTTPDPAAPSTVWHTSLYLDEREYAVLAGLPAHMLTKTRYAVEHAGLRWAVDVLAGRLAGLVLLEVEIPDAEPVFPPYPVVREVTGDVAFTGGALAGLDSPPTLDAP